MTNVTPWRIHALTLSAFALVVVQTARLGAQVVVSEIHYHPVEAPEFDSEYRPALDLEDDVHEFVEIQNAGAQAVDLSGWTLAGGIGYVFPIGCNILPGGYKVIAMNPARIETVYGITGVLGPFVGKLSNKGESVVLRNCGDVTVDAVTYSPDFPWAQSADGLGAQSRFTGVGESGCQYKGRSLQRVSVSGGSSDPANWLASPLVPGPSPGGPQAVVRVLPKPVVIAKCYSQASNGAGVILPNQDAVIQCTFSSTAGLTAVQVEWFVDLITNNAVNEARYLVAMTDLGSGRFRAVIPGKPARSVVRYRIVANRGDGVEVVSPRADDPAVAAVGANNAVQPWHGYFVNPLGRPTGVPCYDLLLGSTNLDRIRGNATSSPGRVTSANAVGKPRAVPWVPATDPQWNGTAPAVFACDGVVYDVHARFHGSRYHRAANSWGMKSVKLHFPKSQSFRGKTSWFITSHGQEFDEATRLNRLLGLPGSTTRNISLYYNNEAAVPRLEQGEYNGEMLDDYHLGRFRAKTDLLFEPNGELYKGAGNRDGSGVNKEGPYTAGDMALIEPNSTWTKMQRHEWMFSLQNHGWKGPRPIAEMLDGMWAARGDTPANPSFQNVPARLAAAKAWFGVNFDIETTLTSMALIGWMSVWDDAKQNQFFWRRANGKWVRLGWDYDLVMSTAGYYGPFDQTIWSGESGAPAVHDGVNWWKDTFYKCFREEYKQRLWQLNNSFCDPANLQAMGFGSGSTAHQFALKRQANVNTQLGLSDYQKPGRPANASPAAAGTVLAGASLKSSAFSHPGAKSHRSTKWEIRSAGGDYEEPVLALTSITALTTLAIPFELLTPGETYFWRVSHTAADGHGSTLSAETDFTWGLADAVEGDLKLNEILAKNKRTIANGTDYPDYIELRNLGATAYDLSGVSLTDDTAMPAKFVFPQGTAVAAGGHLLVWCDREFTAAGLHTGFKLSADGQTVALMKGAVVLDSVVFGPQAPDLAIGRVIDGSGAWTANIPTPNATNVAATLGDPSALRINEWMSKPAYGDDWFEIHNSASLPVALGGIYLSDTPSRPAITRVPELSFIGAGGFSQFLANGISVGGNNCNFKLSANGESLVLTAANGITTLDIINFNAQAEDVSSGRFPDGGGAVVAFPSTVSAGKPNWLPAAVVINELLANPASGDQDWLELYNPGGTAVDIGGWWLSDDFQTPKKYRIPAVTVIPAGGFVVFHASDFGVIAQGDNVFGFSSDGDEACLAAANSAGVLTGYQAQTSFGASSAGVTFGRVAATGLPNGAGGAEFWPLAGASKGAANSVPIKASVVISEIMYHPSSNGVVDLTIPEFVELHNPTNLTISLAGWQLKGGSGLSFGETTFLAPGGHLLVVTFDPADSGAMSQFRAAYPSLPPAVKICGPYLPKLANSTHNIELAYPGSLNPSSIGLPGGGVISPEPATGFVNLDKVEYRDLAPWPTSADGGGASLQRINHESIGNSASNWIGSAPTPGASRAGQIVIISPDHCETSVLRPLDFACEVADGQHPYTWSLSTGTLPRGVAINAAGRLLGQPELTGEFFFRLQVTDTAGTSATQDFRFKVNPAPRITCTSVPDATVPQPYVHDFGMAGGTGPCVWSLSAGALPPGCTLTSTGHLSGIPTVGGNFAFKVSLTDTCGASGESAFTLRVTAPLVIAAETLQGVLVSQIYDHQFIISGGVAPYKWTIGGGYVPDDLHLNADGRLSGRLQVAGNFTFILRVIDASLASVTRSFNLVVTDTDSDGDGVSDEWEFANGMEVGIEDGADDPDGDGRDNRSEYIAGTNPQSSASVFAVQSMVETAAGEMTLAWAGVGGRSYLVLSSPDLKTWTPGSAVIDCGNSGPLSATVPTGGVDKLFFKLSVEIRK